MENSIALLSESDLDLVTGGLFVSIAGAAKIGKAVEVVSKSATTKGGSVTQSISATGTDITFVSLPYYY